MKSLTWLNRIYFAAVGLLALLVGFAGYFVPAEVGRMIPWQVPPMHSRFLGAMYLSGLVFMIGAVLARRWCEIRVVTPMIAIWTGMLFVISLFHRHEFDYSLRQVWIWYGAYFIYPLVAAWLAWRHRGDASYPQASTPLPVWARRYLNAQGVVLTLAALALLIAPTAMLSVWPWKATPLLLQIYSAPFLSYGLVSLMLARQSVWLEVRLGGVSLFTFSFLVLVASIMHRKLFSLAENPDRVWFVLFGAATASLAVLTIRAFAASFEFNKTPVAKPRD
jgi:hypothetical protein